MTDQREPIIGIAAWRQNVEILEFPMTIFQIDQEYVKRVRAAGGLPILIPHMLPDQIEGAVQILDGLVLTGGDDVHPNSYDGECEGVGIGMDLEADAREIELVQAAIKQNVPVLGICRGAQIINVAFGGKMSQEITLDGLSDHGPRPEKLAEILDLRHDISVDEDSRLCKILSKNERTVNTTHHQANTKIAPGFRASATATDGTIEAIEPEEFGPFADRYVIGVQWHPEKLPAPQHQSLFDDLVRAALERAYKA